MSADLQERYQSAGDMLADLEGFRKNQAAAEVQSHLMETAPGVAPISGRGEMPKEKYRQRKKRSRKVTILSGVFGVLLLIIAVFVFLWNFWLKSLFTESQRVEVPDFQGKMYEDVLNDSQYKGKYNFKMIIKVDTEHEYGYILSQTPEAGKSMGAGGGGASTWISPSARATPRYPCRRSNPASTHPGGGREDTHGRRLQRGGREPVLRHREGGLRHRHRPGSRGKSGRALHRVRHGQHRAGGQAGLHAQSCGPHRGRRGG
jgi:hypothetical protein